MGSFLSSAYKQFEYYKSLGERAMDQLDEKYLFQQNSIQENSIAIIVQHLAGNMKSRWTDFMLSDGEKEWRNRDQEFEPNIQTKSEMMNLWEEGWSLVFNTIDHLNEEDLEKHVYIRNMGHTVVEAMNRQLCHYSYHVGQIVVMAKGYMGKDWISLSIPLGESVKHNEEKFSQDKKKRHFTEEFLDNEKFE